MPADVLVRKWRWVAARGVIALLFGLLTLFNPGTTLASLVFLFGMFALVDGSAMIVGAGASRKGDPDRVAWMFGGVIGIAAGLAAFFMPGMTAIALLSVIAAWTILLGAAEVVVAIRLRKVMTGEWALVLAGILAIAFGLLMIAFPGAGALAMLLWIGGYALLAGILLTALALELRSWDRTHVAGASL
jgi:uncharacterized membrane protein HdeD (DUF308 family)